MADKDTSSVLLHGCSNDHQPIKSFAEITSCHTINISDNFPCCYREDVAEKLATVGVPSNSTDLLNAVANSKGSKRPRNDEDIGTRAGGFKQAHFGIQYLHDSVPEVSQSFEVISKIGEGTFSSVYLASVKDVAMSKVALKHLIPTSSTTRIENEIKCLKSMGGKANVIELKACIRHKDHIVLVMPYFPHDKFIDYLPHITLHEVRMYMFALFQALSNVHSHHIIHRDIKPSNFLYHRDSKRFRLVDFGLAQLEPGRPTDRGSRSKQQMLPPPPPDTYRRQTSKRVAAKKTKSPSTEATSLNSLNKHASKTMRIPLTNPATAATTTTGGCMSKHSRDEVCNECQARKGQIASRAGTPGFRAPEVLLKCPNQTTAIDIWSAGVILLCLLSGRYPFFRAHDDQSALAQIMCLMGSKNCEAVSDILGKELICKPEVSPVDLKHVCNTLRSSMKKGKGSSSSTSNPRKKSRHCINISGVTDGMERSPQPSPRLNGPTRTCSLSSSEQQQQQGNSTSSDLTSSNVSSSSSSSNGVDCSWDVIPDCLIDLLKQCLDINPKTRLTAHNALSHSFFSSMNNLF